MDDTTQHSLERFLTPISEDAPAGSDERANTAPNAPYYRLKDLRNQARALERQSLVEDEVTQAEQWRQLLAEIPPVLCERSKDLELVAWYIESLCRTEGFAGLEQGFILARRMLETHWEVLYPLPDEDGPATRMAPLVGLNGEDAEGTLIQPILSIPLFEDAAGNVYAAWHCEQAADVGRLNEDRAAQRIRAGAVSPEALAQAVRETPATRLLETQEAIEAAQRAFNALSETMDRVMDGEPQATSHIRQALERCRVAHLHHAGDRIEQARQAREAAAREAAEAASAPDEEGAPQGAATGGADPVQVALKSRAQALSELRRLANFFRQTEPHSPVSYAIDQAVRWSELSLPELMQELIADSSAREGFRRITGVPEPETRD